jgi:hypothetical protein
LSLLATEEVAGLRGAAAEDVAAEAEEPGRNLDDGLGEGPLGPVNRVLVHEEERLAAPAAGRQLQLLLLGRVDL